MIPQLENIPIGFLFLSLPGTLRLVLEYAAAVGRLFTAAVTLEDTDYSYFCFKRWAGKRNRILHCGSSRAIIPNPSFRDLCNASKNWKDTFNFERLIKQLPWTIEPFLGATLLIFKKRLFILRYCQETRSNLPVTRCSVQIICLGFSTRPIEQLLEDVKLDAVGEDEGRISIWYPGKKGIWSLHLRHPRPIKTVVLDVEIKVKITSEIDRFLRPRTEEWYASKGLPYRRGYLFHGPPGTGKTSFAIALASLFGLSIFVCNIRDTTDIQLWEMLSRLPKRCIILFEDIDAVPLHRNNPKKNEKSETSCVTLTGVLNVIDGLFAPEGRVLIMTANHPGKLDPALTRPGRVDRVVEFSLASREQIRQVFTRVFEDKEPTSKKASIEEMATKFANHFPNKTVSPAAIEEYLVGKRGDPQEAIEGAEEFARSAPKSRSFSREDGKGDGEESLETGGDGESSEIRMGDET